MPTVAHISTRNRSGRARCALDSGSSPVGPVTSTTRGQLSVKSLALKEPLKFEDFSPACMCMATFCSSVFINFSNRGSWKLGSLLLVPPGDLLHREA